MSEAEASGHIPSIKFTAEKRAIRG